MPYRAYETAGIPTGSAATSFPVKRNAGCETPRRRNVLGRGGSEPGAWLH